MNLFLALKFKAILMNMCNIPRLMSTLTVSVLLKLPQLVLLNKEIVRDGLNAIFQAIIDILKHKPKISISKLMQSQNSITFFRFKLKILSNFN